jgi:hypothetical protein
VAEKYEALVDLAGTNSRMKDFYDLWMLARTTAFDGATLGEAIRRTFQRRGTALPPETPIGLSAAWASDEQVTGFWRGFLARSGLQGKAPALADVVAALREFLLPPTAALRDGVRFDRWWPPGGPWRAHAGETGVPDQ